MRVPDILGPALGAVVGGAVAALVTVWATAPDKPAKKRTKSEAAISAEAPAELEERVKALENTVGRLSRRSLMPVIAASGQPPGAPGAPDARKEAAPLVDDPVFEAAVRDVMQRASEERDVEKEFERSERRKQRVEEWATELTQKLRLTDQQRVKVAEIASQYWQSMRDARESDAGFQGRDARRAKMNELRQQAEARLGQVLDATQMQSYHELDQEDRLGVRRGGRDRDRGDRPPSAGN